MLKIFKRKSEKSSGIMGLPVAEQKKVLKSAAEKSTSRQLKVLERYRQTFGEKVKNRSK
jgi:hypothetical protein